MHMDPKRHFSSRTHRAGSQAACRGYISAKALIAALVCVLVAVTNLSRKASARPTLSFRSGTEAAGVVMPIYLSTTNITGSINLQAAAVIRIDSIKQDFQRRGFFRIGVLPLVALDGFTIEIIDTNRTAEALMKAHHKLKHFIKSASEIEARHVAVVFGGQQQATISAQELRFGNDQSWQLEQGIVAQGGQRRHFDTAVFHLAGKDAGQINCRGSSQQFHLQVAHPIGTNPSEQ